MPDRIASIVSVLPLLAACSTPSAGDPGLDKGGVVDGQALTDKLRCPRGASIVHGQTMGVETAVWCEKPGGIKHGPFVEWFENHQKKSAGEYVEGQRQGAWSFWLPNGQLDSRITYERGAVVSTESGGGSMAPGQPATAPATAPATTTMPGSPEAPAPAAPAAGAPPPAAAPPPPQ